MIQWLKEIFKSINTWFKKDESCGSCEPDEHEEYRDRIG